jgi:hypothetical protein
MACTASVRWRGGERPTSGRPGDGRPRPDGATLRVLSVFRLADPGGSRQIDNPAPTVNHCERMIAAAERRQRPSRSPPQNPLGETPCRFDPCSRQQCDAWGVARLEARARRATCSCRPGMPRSRSRYHHRVKLHHSCHASAVLARVCRLNCSRFESCAMCH